VPIDVADGRHFVSESLDVSDFPSEAAEMVRVSVLPPAPVAAPTAAPQVHPEAKPSIQTAASNWLNVNWRNAVMAVLGVAVIVQGGLMAYWAVSGRPFPWAATRTGNVTITSEPAGSPVSIDGTERGQTPLTVSLNPGAYSVVVGSGELARTQSVNVTGGSDASMHVQLPQPAAAPAPTTGAVQITTEPPGARVWVDGELRGVAPITVSNLNAGDHAITVRSGGDPINRTVSVQNGATASLVVTMPGAGSFASGWLAISSPISLQVMEKGALLGTTDIPRLLLPAGAHELELVNASLGFSMSRSVTIAAGRTASLAVTPPRGSLSVNAIPWAEVWIDGQRVGETPIGNYSIAIGQHDVLFRHPELGEQRKTVIVGAQGAARIGVDMKKP
jgi:hypothetical protein